MLQFILSLTDDADRDKVEELYNKYHVCFMKCAVTKFKAMGRSNCLYDAEDAVQNTCAKISKYFHNIDFSRGEKDVKNYCFSILNNEITNILKENQENYEFSEELCPGTEYSFIDELETRDLYGNLFSAIKKLDTKYSTTLHLFINKGMSPNEIADLMEISPKTVYTRLARGKKLLLDSLNGVEIDEKN